MRISKDKQKPPEIINFALLAANVNESFGKIPVEDITNQSANFPV
jgi:hypothetical protein